MKTLNPKINDCQNCGNACDEFETNSYDGICELCYINKYPNLDTGDERYRIWKWCNKIKSIK